MKKETKKTLKKILVASAVIIVAGGAGYGIYKKNPQFKGFIDSSADKIKGMVKGCCKKSPEAVAIEKPRPIYVNKHGVAYKK